MKRTALMIVILFVVSVAILPKPDSTRLTSYQPKIDAPMRTILLPPIPAPPVVPVVAPVAVQPSWDTVTPAQRAAWSKVRFCEEGPGTAGWQTNGATYAGGLGISRRNWTAYNVYWFPDNAAEATPDMQIMVAERIQSRPPDQHGCAAW